MSLKELVEYTGITTDNQLKDFDEAIRLDPKMAHAYLWRGMIHLCGGKTDDALRDFVECVRLDPAVHPAHTRLGKLYESKQKLYQALASYAEALKLEPKDKDSAANVERLTKYVRQTWAKPSIKLVSIELDDEMKKVVVKKSPVINLAADTEKVVDDTIRVRHSTSVTNAWKAEIEVKGKVSAWFVEVETALRGGIEQSTNRTFGVETERKRSVTIKGTKSGTGVRVVWVDYYRTGKAKVELDGQELELPFEFKEDFDLLTETADLGKTKGSGVDSK